VRLTQGDPLTKLDVEAAARHAHEAHARARRAHLAAAESHRHAGEAHDRAARTHRRAASEGIGDVATHLHAVTVHEAARDHDYRAAELEAEMAARE
jgi:hypothetical protein